MATQSEDRMERKKKITLDMIDGETRTLKIRWLGGVKEITKPHLRELDVTEWRCDGVEKCGQGRVRCRLHDRI